MDSITEFMAKDHDRLDGIFGKFRNLKNADLKKAKLLFNEFKTGLHQHIAWEEEILFPIFDKEAGMHDQGPTAAMRMEHQQIKGFLEKIHAVLIGNTIDGVAELENQLLEVLTGHNEKEEGILYPWIDNSAGEKEKEEALEKIKKMQ